ncbi:Hypothetical protein R9X50_00655800 [Acrodontium crateriforme]|uniref:Probable methionine--tRNA ligase, mitochondrial n=1 Tax=Acrodontium crateriforme TaxID=150365 RepID=A0AAQ3RC80_9PEZI|nr:Hypothetical protein R9X50_00655800 [Acrodontium crateriforme]
MLPSWRAGALTPLQSLLPRRWHRPRLCLGCRHPIPPSPRTMTTATATTPSHNDKRPQKPFYITTPIFYVNARPHVGHMYTMVLTDVINRYQALTGRKAIMCTGTDEHGLKIQQAAAKVDTPPQEFCDGGAAVFKQLAGSINVDYGTFIRTSSPQHREAVEYAWHMLQDRGYIYESKHEGWYSVSDETFYPETQVELIIDPPTGRKIMSSIETGKEVEWTSERNYHFRLSAFKDRLLLFYKENPEFVVPHTRMSDLVREVESGLSDLSVSRPAERLTWGVTVPTDPSQTIYVWLDALLSYATAAGYPFTPGAESTGGWPADVHVIGKDIVRFHCIYWPAFLMALDLPLPKQILTHAHWTLGRKKMAKSTGNVVDPFFALERFGIDAMRWYLVHDGGITDDADYDNRYIISKYKKGLQGGLGNLASRLMRAKSWDVAKAVKRYAHPNYVKGQDSFPAVSAESNSHGRMLYGSINALPSQVDKFMKELHPNRALQTIMERIYDANAFLQKEAPWALTRQLEEIAADTTGQLMHDLSKSGSSPEKLEAEIDRSIYLCAETVRVTSIMLQPFIPESATRLLDFYGVQPERRGVEWAVVGKDDTYGTPMFDANDKVKATIFPPLTSDF